MTDTVIDIHDSSAPEENGIILTIDPGSSAMGMAVWYLHEGKDLELVSAITLRPKKLERESKQRRPYYRAVQTFLRFQEWVQGVGIRPLVVAIEPYHLRQSAGQQIGLPLIIGMLTEWSITHDAQVVWVEYGTWAKYRESYEYARLVQSCGRTSDHARDAIGIGVCLANVWTLPAVPPH